MAEITSPVLLCDLTRSGHLNPGAVGWSRTPLHTCNLRGRWPRKKRWNYWAVTNETHLFSMTVSNVDYLGLAFVYLVDFTTGAVMEETVVAPFGRGCELPATVEEDVVYTSRKLQMAMRHVDHGGLPAVALTASMPGFGGIGLEADVIVTYPANHETLNVVIPWDERRFQFTAKHNTLPATGGVKLGSDEIQFGTKQSFATLDFGRGVWPTKSSWNWGSASGVSGGRTIGIQVGGQWTDGTGQTENGVCIDGVLVKCDEDLVWDYDSNDWMRPWRISSPRSDAIDLVFTPHTERVAATNALVLRSEVHQLFGTYSGTVLDPNGEVVAFDGLIGWAEDHVAVW